MSATDQSATHAADSSAAAETRADGEASARRNAWPYAFAAVVALVGLADSVYLTAKHYEGGAVRCTVVSGCNEVLQSAYASVGGVPLAAFGAAAYFAAFSLATLSAFGYRLTRPLLALLVAVMLCATLWLLYVQAFVLGQFCSYCLLSAAVTITLAATMTQNAPVVPSPG